jgi:hypothetical protein
VSGRGSDVSSAQAAAAVARMSGVRAQVESAGADPGAGVEGENQRPGPARGHQFGK